MNVKEVRHVTQLAAQNCLGAMRELRFMDGQWPDEEREARAQALYNSLRDVTLRLLEVAAGLRVLDVEPETAEAER